jgi:hypothetical protein
MQTDNSLLSTVWQDSTGVRWRVTELTDNHVVLTNCFKRHAKLRVKLTSLKRKFMRLAV